MMTKNKKLLGLTALTLGVVVCGASLTASLASADSVPTDTYAWEFTQMPSDFSISGILASASRASSSK